MFKEEKSRKKRASVIRVTGCTFAKQEVSSTPILNLVPKLSALCVGRGSPNSVIMARLRGMATTKLPLFEFLTQFLMKGKHTEFVFYHGIVDVPGK